MILHVGLSTRSTTSIACSVRLMKMGSDTPQEIILETDASDPTMDGLNTGINIVTSSYSLTSQLEAVDIVLDMTPSPAVGTETDYGCIQNSKDTVMVIIEAAVTVGRDLEKHADQAGVLYAVS